MIPTQGGVYAVSRVYRGLAVTSRGCGRRGGRRHDDRLLTGLPTPARILVLGLAASALAASGQAVAAHAANCGSLTFHSGSRTAKETSITASGVSCAYATKVFLPKAAEATPAAAAFFATWNITSHPVAGGLTEYVCRKGKETITYRVKTP